MPEPRFNLSPSEAIAELKSRLSQMKAEPDKSLADVDPETAFELGYETAIFEYEQVTGPDSMEAEVIIYTPKETTDVAE